MNTARPTGPNGGSWIAINGTASSISTSAAYPRPYAPRRATAAAIMATPKPMLPPTDKATITPVEALQGWRRHRGTRPVVR